MFYGVYFYAACSSGCADVKLLGFYDTLQKAKDALAVMIPDYSPNYGNSVSSGGRIGWVNVYEMNTPLQLSCWQPHTSVNLFTPSE